MQTTTKVNGHGTTTTESSTLFSLASLGAMAAQPAPPRPTARVDELLGIGALPAPALAAPLVAPVVVTPPPAASTSTSRWIVSASIVAVLILGASYAAARSLVQPPAARPRVDVVAVADPAPMPLVETTTPVLEATPPVTVAQLETPPAVASPDPTPTPRHPHPVRTTPPSDPVTTPVTTPEPPTTRIPHSVAEMLATPPEPHPHAVTPPTPVAVTTPTRPEVLAAMRAVTPAVTACSGGAHGLATVSVRMTPNGHVTSAVVSGDFAGTPVGSCIARAVRGAEVPAFTQSSFGFDYPFRF